MKCCNCPNELQDTETYICDRCKAEIDREADEVMGNDGIATVANPWLACRSASKRPQSKESLL